MQYHQNLFAEKGFELQLKIGIQQIVLGTSINYKIKPLNENSTQTKNFHRIKTMRSEEGQQ